jgi:hypothetical protein
MKLEIDIPKWIYYYYILKLVMILKMMIKYIPDAARQAIKDGKIIAGE